MNMCVHVSACMCVYVQEYNLARMWQSEDNYLGTILALWIPGIEPRSPGLVASIFTPKPSGVP